MGHTGVAFVASSRAGGVDRDRSFYPTVLVVIALLCVLFGVETGAPTVIAAELAMALLALGLALHGAFDLVHPAVLPASDAAPPWWPAFCLGVNGAFALWVWTRWPAAT